MTCGGRSGGGACPPTRIVRKAYGSMRASATGTSEVSVAPSAAAAATAAGSKRACAVRGVPVSSARVTTASPPTCASGRQASQRSRALGRRPAVHSSPSQKLQQRCASGQRPWVGLSCCSSTPRAHRRPRRARLHPGRSVRRGCRQLPVGRSAASTFEPRGCRQRRVERRDCIAAVPRSLQRINEGLAGAVESHQLAHVRRL